MSSEIATYTQELCWLLDQFSQAIDTLTQQQFQWRPSIGTANAASTIVRHVLRSTRVYVLGFACHQPVSRNRTSEFSPSDSSVTTLVTALHSLRDEITVSLATLVPSQLEERFVPVQELWGETVPVRELSRRDALVASIRHAALHLGELRLTCDLMRHSFEV